MKWYTDNLLWGVLKKPCAYVCQDLRALALTCDVLRLLWSTSNLHASQYKVFTVWSPKSTQVLSFTLNTELQGAGAYSSPPNSAQIVDRLVTDDPSLVSILEPQINSEINALWLPCHWIKTQLGITFSTSSWTICLLSRWYQGNH